MTSDDVEAAIVALEDKMPTLQALHHADIFRLANAWANHHDALVAATPGQLRLEVEERLHRIGIRWGVAHGARTTGQFLAIKA